jgi:hypothetical protein
VKSQRVGLSRALVWVCVGALILSGPGQTLALVARGLDAPPARAEIRGGRSADLGVSIDTRAYAGQRGRILMRLRAEGAAAGTLTIRWTARHALTGGIARSGERAVVAGTATLGQSIEDVMTFEVQSSGAADARIDIRPEFEFEAADGQASRLTATGADGAPLHVVLTPSQMFAGVAPLTRWAVRSPEAEPMPAGVQVTSSGVRLQRDFANTRVAFSPEFSDQYGFAFKGAVGRAVSSRAAFGLVGGGGRSQSDLVGNFGWQVSPTQRLLVSGGSLQQDTDLAFDSGMERRGLRQASGGAAYSFTLAGKFQPRFDTQGYFASSPSQDLGSLQFFREAEGAAQIFRQDRRVAGALLTGAQTHASFAVLPMSTLTVSVGAERLRYAMATGDQSTTTLTRGVEWAQQLSGGYAVQALARTQAAMNTTGIGIERAFRAHGQRLGVTLTKIDGRNGVADDLQLRLTHTMAFGSGTRVAPQARVSGVAETDPVMDALLNEVSQRPAFLPLVSLAKVDRSRGAERLVAVDRAGMVPGTRVDELTGTVSVPTGASIITGLTRNGMPFSNTGQFSTAAGELRIHPMVMEVPVNNDQYLVSMQRPDNGLTTVSVDVARGSVHITRVTVVRGEADTTPDAFSFSSPGPAPVNTAVISAPVAITGLGTAAPISITGGEYSIDGGPFTSSPGTITDGQSVAVRVMTPAGYGMTAMGTLIIGGVSGEFTVSSEAAISTPAAFTFSPRAGADLDALVESDDVVVAGMNVPGAISIAGGEYRVNGGAFTSAAGEISSGDTVRVRVRSSAAAATATSTTLSIGGLSVAFVATTAAAGADTTPEAFTFAAETGAARSTAITSAAATIAGMNAAAPISITGGEYSIDGGPFTSAAGTVSAGQSVRLRLTSAAGYSTTSTSTVTIGGIVSEFSVTTGAEPGIPDTTPEAFGFTTQNDLAVSTVVTSDSVTINGLNAPAAISTSSGSQYSIDNGPFTSAAGTIANSQSVRVLQTTSATVGTSSTATVTIGGVAGTFTASTIGADTTPDAFSFATQTGLAVNTVVTSDSATITGLNTAAAISIGGGSQYSIDNAAFTSATGTIGNGQSVRVRLTTSSSVATSTSATVTIGGVAGTFTASTIGADPTPDAFGFPTQSDVPVSTEVTSESATIGGLTASTGIASTGGEYSIDNAAFTSAAGTVENGQSVRVRLTTAPTVATSTTATVTIGGVAGTFTASTVGADTTPDAFSFTPQNNLAVSTEATSDVATISGLNTPAAISISGGGSYSIDNAAFTSAGGTITNGQTVHVRLTTSSSLGTPTTATLTIGGVEGTFSTTTVGADTTPDAFSFTTQDGLAVSTVVTSNTIAIEGVNTPASISVTDGEYSIQGGPFTSSPGTIAEGEKVRVRLTTSANVGTATTATLTVGSVSATFTASTVGPDTTPDAFAFTPHSEAKRSTTRNSDEVTITGINTAAPISITGGQYKIDSGGYTSANGTITSGQKVTVEVTSSASFSTLVAATVTIGTVTGTFNVTTEAIDTTPDAFSFLSHVDVAEDSQQTSNAISVSGINAPAPISIEAGHPSSEYSINGASFTKVAGTVVLGDEVRVRHIATSADGVTHTNLTIGGVSAKFVSTTDTTPTAFSFVAATGVLRSTSSVSNQVTIAGITGTTAISISGGEYKVDALPYTNVPGTVTNGQVVRVRLTSSATYGTLTSATLTIGGVAGTYNVTTEAADTTPNAFGFTAETGVARSTTSASNLVTITGITGNASISITGGEYKLADAPYTNTPGTVTDGQTVRVRLTSSSSYSTMTSATLTVGGVTGTYNVTTEALDNTPNAFSFNDRTAVDASTTSASNIVTITGITSGTAISVTGGATTAEYRVNGAAWTSASGVLNSGDTVQVRHTTRPLAGQTTTTTQTVGTVSATYVTTNK